MPGNIQHNVAPLQETWGRCTMLPPTPPRRAAGQMLSSAADTCVHMHATWLPDTHVCTLMHRPVCEIAHTDTRGHTAHIQNHAHTQAIHARHDRVGTEMHTHKTTRVHTCTYRRKDIHPTVHAHTRPRACVSRRPPKTPDPSPPTVRDSAGRTGLGAGIWETEGLCGRTDGRKGRK